MQYVRNFLSFFVLVITIGFPRLYGTEIPMAILMAPFFIVGFSRFILKKIVLFFILFILFFSGFFLGVFSFINGSGDERDLFFHIVIYAKIVLTYFFGYVVYKCIYKNSSVLFCWILFQIFVVFLSIFNEKFYKFLLGFISPRSADVFQHIFGIRALGFGLFHMEGAITFVFSVFLYAFICKNGKKISSIFALLISLPVSMSVARSAMVPYFLFSVFMKGRHVKALLFPVVIIMFIVSIFVESGPLYEASEIFRNILSGKGFYSESVASLSTMYSFPKELSTYIIGDGMYYAKDGDFLSFYMGTDVGYMRLLYFSGLFSTFIFIIINTIICFYGIFLFSSSSILKYRFYFIVSILVFFIINAKGIQVAPFFSVVAFYYLISTDLAQHQRTLC